MIRGTFIIFLCIILTAQNLKGQEILEIVKPQKPLRVIIFMAADCPITQKYMKTIKELALKYNSQGVVFQGWFPTKITPAEIETFRKEYAIPDIISLNRDYNQKVVKRYHATITPEAFLIDSNDNVIYHGAIDNWVVELGRFRRDVSEFYLKDAIETSLKGEQPSVSKTLAFGCFIQSKKMPEPTIKAHH